MPCCHQQSVLERHNEFRKRHGAPPLLWSIECLVHAQKCADENAANRRPKNCFLVAETTSRQMGQSIYMGGGPVENAMQSWYDELWGYDFETPGRQEGTSHFTAMVWYDTTHVGVARSRCGTFIVANYFPVGNWESAEHYRKNVLPPSAAYRWRPRNELEHRLSSYFLQIAQEKEKKRFTDDPMMVPTRTLFELFWHMGEKKLAEAVLDADTDHDGNIDVGEFTTAACTLRHSDGSNSKDLQRSVRRIAGIVTVDENGDCKLDPREFHNYLKIMTSRSFTADEVTELLEQFDKDGDGMLDYQELVALHDSGALLEKPSVLIERWGRDVEKMLEDVPKQELIRAMKAHLREGGKARMTRTDTHLVIKLISEETTGQTSSKTIQGSWTPEEAEAWVASSLQVGRYSVRPSTEGTVRWAGSKERSSRVRRNSEPRLGSKHRLGSKGL